MIEALKSDEIVHKVGGRFKLTALIQKRMLELMDGARPLVDRGNMTDLEVVIQEILQDKIYLDAAGIVHVANATMMANIPGSYPGMPGAMPPVPGSTAQATDSE